MMLSSTSASGGWQTHLVHLPRTGPATATLRSAAAATSTNQAPFSAASFTCDRKKEVGGVDSIKKSFRRTDGWMEENICQQAADS